MKSLRDLNERLQSWERLHPKKTLLLQYLSIIIFSIAVVYLMYGLSVRLGLITILSTDALKILIEAEATILGFFGLVAIYALTSFDNRIDKLEERIDDNVERGVAIRNSIIPTNLPIRNPKVYEDRKSTIIKRKQGFTVSMIISLGSLFISFFLTIYAYGILTISDISLESKVSSSFLPIIIGFVLLFVGILSIFLMLYRMGKEPNR